MTTPVPQPCAEWADVLTITHPDDLSPSWQAALEAHLATCPACSTVRADYERLDGYIQHLPTSRPLPAFPSQLLGDGTPQRAGRRATPRPGQSSIEFSSAPRLIPQTRGTVTLFSGRLKSAATVATLVVVVALFAVLLRTVATGHTGGSSPAQKSSPLPTSPTALSTPTSPQAPVWQATALPGLTNQSSLPVIAPSNPSVVYEDLAQANTPTQIKLRRSDDSGATWQNLPLPIQVPSGVDDSSLAVSPLDASTVFFTLSMPDINGDTPACHAGQALVSNGNALARLSGEQHCSLQYISTDSGRSWSRVQLPLQGAIGAPQFPELQAISSANIFSAQGQRLYAALAAGGATIGGVDIGVDGVRIVTSTDGGKSWHLADAQLAASNENICDFAPASTGSTLFAITQVDSYCYYDSTSLNYLWRSDDAGATWAQVGNLPALASELTVVGHGEAAQPTLYARMPVSAQYETIQPSTTPPGLEFSVDGGLTWHQAPTKGLPDGTQKNYGPLAVLSDGSVLKAFQMPDQTLTFAVWRSGDAAWSQIARQVDPILAYLLATASGGKISLWVVTQSGNQYSVLRYTQ